MGVLEDYRYLIGRGNSFGAGEDEDSAMDDQETDDYIGTPVCIGGGDMGKDIWRPGIIIRKYIFRNNPNFLVYFPEYNNLKQFIGTGYYKTYLSDITKNNLEKCKNTNIIVPNNDELLDIRKTGRVYTSSLSNDEKFKQIIDSNSKTDENKSLPSTPLSLVPESPKRKLSEVSESQAKTPRTKSGRTPGKGKESKSKEEIQAEEQAKQAEEQTKKELKKVIKASRIQDMKEKQAIKERQGGAGPSGAAITPARSRPISPPDSPPGPPERDVSDGRRLFTDNQSEPSNSNFLSASYTTANVINGNIQHNSSIKEREDAIENIENIKKEVCVNGLPALIVDYRYYPEPKQPMRPNSGFYYDVEVNENQHIFVNNNDIRNMLTPCPSIEKKKLNQEKPPFRINLFNVLDKIKPIPSGIDLRLYRLRQLFTFCQFPIFDTIHDMVVGDNLKAYKKIYIFDVLKSYREEMLNLITDDLLNDPNLGISDVPNEVEGGSKLSPDEQLKARNRAIGRKEQTIKEAEAELKNLNEGKVRELRSADTLPKKIEEANKKLKKLKDELEILKNSPLGAPIKSQINNDFNVAKIPDQMKKKIEKEEKDKEQPFIDPAALNRLTSSHLLKDLSDLNGDKIKFIKKYIFPKWKKKEKQKKPEESEESDDEEEDVVEDDEDADYYVFGMFTLTKKYITSLTGSTLPKRTDRQRGDVTLTSENLGVNVSNMYPVNALEILGMKPFGYNMSGQYSSNFKDFLYTIQLNQQQDRLQNKIITTFDTVGKLPELTNITGLLRKEIDPQIKLVDLRTPAKNYDSAWISDHIFGDKDTIEMSGDTKYEIYFEGAGINHPFVEFDLLNGGRTLKLYKFGNYSYPAGLETGKGFYAPKSSSNRHVAIKIAECYNNFEKEGVLLEEQRRIVRFLSFFKFGGDFIQGIWQYILAYPNEFKDNTNYINFYNQQELNGLKLHIATDTLSAIISSLFGGLVVTANSQFSKLGGLQAGGTEFFFLKESLYNYFDEKINQSKKLEDCIDKTIEYIWKCETNKEGLDKEIFISTIKNDSLKKDIIKTIIIQQAQYIKSLDPSKQISYEPFDPNCNSGRMKEYKNRINSGYHSDTEEAPDILAGRLERVGIVPMQEFGKKRVKDLSEDFKYLLTL
jgi:hypothetical protein